MRQIIQKFLVLFCCALALPTLAQEDDDLVAGPLYSEFRLTLQSGYRREAAGPLFYSQQAESQWQWALPPLYCYTRTPDVDWVEMETLYPLIDYRRYGREYRFEFLQVFNFSGGQASLGDESRRFTIFPLYFQQRAADTNLNYTAVVPFYGEMKNRLYRDDIKFVMFPLYSETRKKDVVTDNYLFPFFDARRGDHLTGWQFWPVVGVERKTPTLRTNVLDEAEIVGGHDKFFAAWPFYFKSKAGLGTTNEEASLTLVPFYSRTHSATRDLTCYGWPLGYNVIEDREQKYVEHDVLWPLGVVARGGKTVTRVWPFFSQASNADIESDFYLWPLYKFNRMHAGALDRQRTRIAFFLFSNIQETNRESGARFEREDFWPFYTYHRETDGSQRWQAFAFLEPFFPNNRSLTREYAQTWSVWRYEKNHKSGATSQSLLWNLYRREVAPGSKNCSLLFGLLQYHSGAKGWRCRVCYMTVAKKAARAADQKT